MSCYLRSSYEYCVVLFMFLVSGGVYFFRMNASIFVPLYFILSFFFYYFWGYRNRMSRISKHNILSLVILASLYILSSLITDMRNINFLITNILLLAGTFLTITSITFSRFRTVYLDICFVLALLGIILFFLVDVFTLLRPTVINFKGTTWLIYAYHNFGWGRLFHRLAGIYWEPGAFQIVLNTSLILFYDKITSVTLKKVETAKILIIIIACLLTQSTAGYIVLAVFLSTLVYNFNRIRKKISTFLLPFLIFTLLSIYSIYNSTVVQDKFLQTEDDSSFQVRLADNLGMIRMIMERPLDGYGFNSNEYLRRSKRVNNETSSNGILAMAASFGIPFLLIYFTFLYKGLYFVYKKDALFLFPVLILLQSGEVFFIFPIANIFLFKFKHDKILLKKYITQQMNFKKESIS